MGQTDLLERLDHLDRVELLETEVYQDFQVPLDLEVNLVHLDPKEREEILVNPGRKDLLDLQGLKDPQVPLEPLDNEERRVHLANKELLVLLEDPGTRDLLAEQDLPDLLDFLDHQERLAPLDQLESEGREVLMVPLEWQDPQVLMASQDHQVSRDVLGKRVGLEEREARDTGDSLVSKVSLGLLDHQERKDPQGTQARTEWLEHLDQGDPLDLMGLLGPWEILVLWDLEDLQERREGEDLLEN